MSSRAPRAKLKRAEGPQPGEIWSSAIGALILVVEREGNIFPVYFNNSFQRTPNYMSSETADLSHCSIFVCAPNWDAIEKELLQL